MLRTQIYLTEKERKGLQSVARTTGRKQSELIREAVDRFLEHAQEGRRAAVLKEAAGMWRDRNDLPEAEELRRSWDRSPAQ